MIPTKKKLTRSYEMYLEMFRIREKRIHILPVGSHGPLLLSNMMSKPNI
jgi:hypothetical protein